MNITKIIWTISFTGLFFYQIGWSTSEAADTEFHLEKIRRSEAKMKAAAMYSDISIFHIDKNKYPNKSELEKIIKENPPGRYQIGTIEMNPQIKGFCPDCIINKTGFKIAVYGNIDDDNELDVITINDKKEMILIKDDTGEAKGPINLMK